MAPPGAAEILERVRSSPPWDECSIFPVDREFPRLILSNHGARGFVLHYLADDRHFGDFLATRPALSSPDVEINLGGQALERWPAELFVSEPLAREALEVFLATGGRAPGLHWIAIDAFPRETIWDDAETRSLRERSHDA